MRRTKEEAEATRKTLMETALLVFSEQGYANTKLEDIAIRANVTRGAIYHHFGSKADLFNCLLEEIGTRISGVIDKAVAEGGNNLDIFRRIIVYNMAYLEEDDEYRAVIELSNIRTGVPPELEGGLEIKIERTEALTQEIAGYFRNAIDMGEIRPELDPYALALTFFSLQNGLVTNWLLMRRSFSIKVVAPTVADIFIAGIKKS